MFIHIDPQPTPLNLTDAITNGQRWYTLPSGVKYPSVTTVLGQKEKPQLTNWRNMLGPKKADKETKRCAERGTAVHKMAENFLNNIDNPTNGHSIDHQRLFRQLTMRLNKVNNIHAQELPLYSETLKVAGRVDCIAEYKGQLSVIDFKTSNNNKDIDIIEDYFLQCTAYALMYEELYGIFIENVVVLIAVEKGIMSLEFTKKIYDYIEPLVERINTFYRSLPK